MNVDRFIREREPGWNELDALARRANGRLEKLVPDNVLRVGALYRSAAADLAIARQRFPADPVVRRLERLVVASRTLVYGSEAKRRTTVDFFTRDYWQALRERPGLLAAAAVLLFVPAIVASAWALADPPHASGFAPGVYDSVSAERTPGQSHALPPDVAAGVSSAIFTNNIRVSFLAFAGGIVFGFGTAVVLLFNGALLGVIGGLAFSAGNGVPFTELVVAHGVLELSCIVVTAAAGLRIGWALVDPGHRPRGEVIVEQARRSVAVVLGTIPWLIVAGLVEGFITPAGLGLATNVTIGVVLGGLFWGLTIFRGRPQPQTLASAFART